MEAPVQPLLRALSVALELPAPLAQWPMHLLHASLTVSFPLRTSGKVCAAHRHCAPLCWFSRLSPHTMVWGSNAVALLLHTIELFCLLCATIAVVHGICLKGWWSSPRRWMRDVRHLCYWDLSLIHI